MKLLDNIAKALGYVPQSKQMENKLLKAMSYYFGDGAPIWAEDNPEKYVEQGYVINTNVYSVVNFLAKKAADVDFQLCQTQSNGDEKIIESHPILDVLYEPNPMQGKNELFEQLYGFYLLSGNTYTYLLYPDNGPNAMQPREIYSLPAPWVEVLGGDYRQPLKGYQISTYGFGKDAQFTTDEVIHTKAAQFLWGEGQEKYGMSPLRAAWRSVQTDNSAYEANKKGLDNMGAAGVLFDKGSSADEMAKTYWTSEQQQLMQDKLQKMSGPKFNKSIMAAVGDLGWINFGLSPIDMALLETLEYGLADICNVYSVQDMLFNSGQGRTYSNLAEARKMAYSDAIIPLVNRVLSDYTRKLIPRYPDLKGKNYYLKANTSNIPEMQDDMEKLAGWLAKSDFLTLNEKRKAMGYKTLPDEMMDEVFIPTSLVPLSLSGIDVPSIAEATIREPQGRA